MRSNQREHSLYRLLPYLVFRRPCSHLALIHALEYPIWIVILIMTLTDTDTHTMDAWHFSLKSRLPVSRYTFRKLVWLYIFHRDKRARLVFDTPDNIRTQYFLKWIGNAEHRFWFRISLFQSHAAISCWHIRDIFPPNSSCVDNVFPWISWGFTFNGRSSTLFYRQLLSLNSLSFRYNERTRFIYDTDFNTLYIGKYAILSCTQFVFSGFLTQRIRCLLTGLSTRYLRFQHSVAEIGTFPADV